VPTGAGEQARMERSCNKTTEDRIHVCLLDRKWSARGGRKKEIFQSLITWGGSRSIIHVCCLMPK